MVIEGWMTGIDGQVKWIERQEDVGSSSTLTFDPTTEANVALFSPLLLLGGGRRE